MSQKRIPFFNNAAVVHVEGDERIAALLASPELQQELQRCLERPDVEWQEPLFILQGIQRPKYPSEGGTKDLAIFRSHASMLRYVRWSVEPNSRESEDTGAAIKYKSDSLLAGCDDWTYRMLPRLPIEPPLPSVSDEWRNS